MRRQVDKQICLPHFRNADLSSPLLSLYYKLKAIIDCFFLKRSIFGKKKELKSSNGLGAMTVQIINRPGVAGAVLQTPLRLIE